MRDEGMNDYVDDDDDDQGCYEEEDYSVPVDLETNVYQVNSLNSSCTSYTTNKCINYSHLLWEVNFPLILFFSVNNITL